MPYVTFEWFEKIELRAMSKYKPSSNVVEFDSFLNPKPVHEQFLDLAKKGFGEPASLNADEIWHLCRAFIFYSAQLDGLLATEAENLKP